MRVLYTVCIVKLRLAAPWVAAAAAGLSAITVNPDILWLCILHTSHPLLASALRNSPRHCAKGLPPNTDSGRGEMVMEKRAAGHPSSHFIAHNPKCLLFTMAIVGLIQVAS